MTASQLTALLAPYQARTVAVTRYGPRLSRLEHALRAWSRDYQ